MKNESFRLEEARIQFKKASESYTRIVHTYLDMREKYYEVVEFNIAARANLEELNERGTAKDKSN